MTSRSLLVACALLACLAARAAEIYMWVDERGRVQMSDVVPDKFRDSAKKVDSRSFELTPQQQSEARARAAKDQAAAAQADADVATDRRNAATAQPRAAAARRARPASAGSDCAAQQRAYVRSQECFAPYLTVNGIKPEAFRRCTVVVDPSGKCGIQPIE